MRRAVFHSLLPGFLITLFFMQSAATAQTVDPTEAAQRILRRCVTPQRDGSHLSLLFALRQLRDPDLHAFFEQLLATSQWQIQVHAALALAELNESKAVDPAVIPSLPAQAQDAVVATALDLEMLPVASIPAILASEDLHPMARMVLLAELINSNRSAEQTEMMRTQLQALCESENAHVIALSNCLLAQLGEADALSALRKQLDALDDRRHVELTLWLFDAIRRYRLTSCMEWVTALASQPDQNPDIIYRSVYTLLELDAPKGLQAWTAALGKNASYQQRIRYCTLLLSAAEKVPASQYDLLLPAHDEDLLLKMVAVGKAIASKRNVSEALIDLLSLAHAKSSEWAFNYTTTLPPEIAAPVYEYVIDRMNEPKRGGDAVEMAVTATSKLFAIDSQKVLQRLKSAEDDGVMQQAILLGLFEANSDEAGKAAASLRRIGSGRADSLALLLIARHSRAMERADVDQLGKIAAGGGGLSEVLQVQAAWMYLKFTGQTAQTLTQLFAQK